MPDVDDGYQAYYADRIWNLIPGTYRANDSDDPDVAGPLQELVARIAGQVAVVRRSIDRPWADRRGHVEVVPAAGRAAGDARCGGVASSREPGRRALGHAGGRLRRAACGARRAPRRLSVRRVLPHRRHAALPRRHGVVRDP